MVTKVWGCGRVGLWSEGGRVDVPDGYEFLAAGDVARTRAVVRAAAGMGASVFVVMEKERRFSRRVGVWVPAAALRVEVRRGDPEKLAANRRRKEEREIAAFREAILERFPCCPPAEAETIARYTCRTGSGRVGRSRTADDPVRAAVVAHVRHVHTKYDDLLAEMGGGNREERAESRRWAREAVADEITVILTAWEQATNE